MKHDIHFVIAGNSLPVDHGYGLFGAISRHLEWLHDSREIFIHPIRGTFTGAGQLSINGHSRLVLRAPTEKIKDLLPLSGKTLEIDGARLMLGVANTVALKPVSSLYSHLVVIKNGHDVDRFDAEIRRQMEELGVKGRVERLDRRIITIKGKKMAGYSVKVSELLAEESILLQESGLGGRHKMGCGVFVPCK